MNEKIPLPITFNTYKHHFHFLLKQIEMWRQQEWKQVEEDLSVVGENLLDFYTGYLTVEKICAECLEYFNRNDINETIAFSNWLYPKEYRKIQLSDSSEWIIKFGKAPDRFIHIHPAKQSPFTIRIRAVTLKTVLALMVKSANLKPVKKNLPTVNHIRSEYLQLSPIKSLQRNKGILQLWEIFLNHYQPNCY